MGIQDWVSILASIVTAIATGFIAYHAFTTHKIANDIKIAILILATKGRSADATKRIYDEYKTKLKD